MTANPGRPDRRLMGQAGDLAAQVMREQAARIKQEARERKPVPSTRAPARAFSRRWPLPGDPEIGSIPQPRTHRARRHECVRPLEALATVGVLLVVAALIKRGELGATAFPWVAGAGAVIALAAAAAAAVLSRKQRRR